jgi:hypothetical protein
MDAERLVLRARDFHRPLFAEALGRLAFCTTKKTVCRQILAVHPTPFSGDFPRDSPVRVKNPDRNHEKSLARKIVLFRLFSIRFREDWLPYPQNQPLRPG